MAEGQLKWYVPDASEVSIRAAAQEAIASGGGVVVLPDATITLTSPLPLATGIQYLGVRPRLTITGAVADLGWTFAGGTIFVGDGTFPGMAGQNVYNATPDPGSAFLSGIRVQDVGFENFTSGIACGADNRQYGASFSVFDGIFTRACTSYAVDFRNFQQCIFADFEDMQSKHGHRFSSGVGNSEINKIYRLGANADRLSRGIWIDVPNPTDWMNQLVCRNIQCNQFNRTELSVAATVTSGDPAMAVADLAEFAVGMPVKFTASVNGFVANRTYFVRSKSAASGAGTIQVAADTYATAVITPSGSSGMTLKSYGFPQLAVTGCANGDHGGITAVTIDGVDLEGNGIPVVIDHTNQVRLNITSIANSGDAYPDIVARSSKGGLIEGAIFSSDLDTDSSVWLGPGAYTAGTQYGVNNFVGPQRNFTSGLWSLALSDASGPSLSEKYGANGRRFVYPDRIMGQKVEAISNTSYNLGLKNGGAIAYDNNTSTTWTLPEILDGMEGLPYEIFNFGTGTLTLNAFPGQAFNKQSAKTSYSLAPGQYLCVLAMKTTGSAYTWAVRGGNGT